MSNDTLSYDDTQLLNSVCAFVSGNGAKSFWSRPNKEALAYWASLYDSNPVITPDEVCQAMGWSSDWYTYLEEQLAPTPMNESATYFRDELALATHPILTGSIVPLFVVFTILSSLAIGFRLYSRKSILGRIQSFDWAAVVSYLLIVAWGGLTVHEGASLGRWASYCDETYSQMVHYFADFDIGMDTYPIVAFSVKFTLLLFYHSLTAWRPLRWAVYITMFICSGNAIAAMLLWILQCNHHDLWNHSVDPNNNCPLDQMRIVNTTGIINIVCDVLIWFIPMPLVWKLQLYTREKVLAVFTFGLGAIACVASIGRLLAVRRYLWYSDNSTLPINAWAIVELNLALICACAPALRALILKHAPKLLSFAYASDSSSKSDDKTAGSSKSSKTNVVLNSDELPSSPSEKGGRIMDWRIVSPASEPKEMV